MPAKDLIGLAVAGATHLAFLMDDTRSGVNDGELGVSTSWLGMFVERHRRKSLLLEGDATEGAGTKKPKKQIVRTSEMLAISIDLPVFLH